MRTRAQIRARLPRIIPSAILYVSEVRVSDHKVVPFRRRRVSKAELEAYQQMTRHWSPTLRQKMSPEHFKLAQELESKRPRR